MSVILWQRKRPPLSMCGFCSTIWSGVIIAANRMRTNHQLLEVHGPALKMWAGCGTWSNRHLIFIQILVKSFCSLQFNPEFVGPRYTRVFTRQTNRLLNGNLTRLAGVFPACFTRLPWRGKCKSSHPLARKLSSILQKAKQRVYYIHIQNNINLLN